MKIATWNVNGVRARQAQLLEWVERERPDVVCLQEIKASKEQVPPDLCDLAGYWCYWHGSGGYSGVALHVRRDAFPAPPEFGHPGFDHETRIVSAKLPGLVVASVYVPNGGKDFEAKLRFLDALARWVGEVRRSGSEIVLAGDMNVTRGDLDVHAKERKAGVIGQRPEERELFERLLSAGVVDVARALEPTNDAMFTWWAPWRNLRQRNIGWRIDYVLASEGTFARATSCTVQRDVGTSDHAPVVVSLSTGGSLGPAPLV